MKHLKTYDKLFESANDVLTLFKAKLNDIGITANDDFMNIVLAKDGKNIGDLRIDTINEWIGVEMIVVYSDFRRQGYGLSIYQALLDAAVEAGYKGLYSPAFDEAAGTGQQRSPEATSLLNKLIDQNGGRVVDVADSVDPLDIEDLKTDSAPFYGPPYLTFYIDNSGRIKKEKE